MGQTVPEVISRLIDLQEINCQFQFDQHFLLSSSAGEVSRFFNEMANLSIIDLSFSRAGSAIAAQKDEIKRYTKSLKEEQDAEKENRKKLPQAIQAKKCLEKVREHAKEMDELHAFKELIESLEQYESKRTEWDAEDALSLLAQCETLLQQSLLLTNEIREIRQLSGGLEDIVQRKVPKTPTQSQMDNVEKMSTSHRTLLADVLALRSGITALVAEAKALQTAQGALEEERGRFEKEFPDTCPLCGKDAK